VNWLEAAQLGACGGAIFALYAPWQSLLAVHRARRACLAKGEPLPRVRDRVDFLGDAVLLLMRTLFGAIAGAVFHSQLTASATAGAIAIGASAPLLLRQLGHVNALKGLLTDVDEEIKPDPEPEIRGTEQGTEEGGQPRLPRSEVRGAP
jgi:hypothetical protein